MKAKDLTFGVEIECLVPADKANGFRQGKYHHGIQIEKAPAGWNSQKDGSLSSESGFVACEVVSPILKGEDGLFELGYMADYLTEVGAKFNSSTGLHIHVNGGHLSPKQQIKLAKEFRQHEAAFMALNGENAGYRLGNYYCRLASDWRWLVDTENRYRSLNFCNLQKSKGTVEFRLFYGDCSLEVLVTAVYMCVGLVAKVSQMSDSECEALTNYPRPVPFTQAAYNFIRSVWNRKANLILDGGSRRDVMAVLMAQAGQVSEIVQETYNGKLSERWQRA